MRKLITKLLKLMPESYRHQFYRSQVQVPQFALDDNFSIEIARTEEDLESAYRLLHDCYVATKLMTPHASGLRCNLYTFLPHSTVIVAKYNGETVGTVSLIRDSVWGLPSDKDYRNENDRLRKAGHKLVEVSALAVSKDFRNRGNSVSLLLMKYLYNYTYQFLNSDCLVCTVHPRAEDFYKALWHFDRNGKVVEYQFVHGALAVHLSMEVSTAKQEKIVASYPSQDLDKNLALFVLSEDSRFKYPSRRLGAQIDPVLTPELFEEFCVKKTGVWSTLTAVEQDSLYTLYHGLFGYCNPTLKVKSNVATPMVRDYRIPIEVSAVVHNKDSQFFVKITDLSVGGAFVAWPKDQAEPDSHMMISFKVGDMIVKIKAEVAWKNNGKSHLQPYGFGIKFPKAKALEGVALKNWLYSQAG